MSFGEEKEFNMLPLPSLDRLNTHKYNINNFEILKMASTYGANGAGKSNLIKSLLTLQNFIIEKNDKIPNIDKIKFKFQNNMEDKAQVFVIEFFQDNRAFLYGLEILNNIVITEELYLSGLGQRDETLLFERKTDKKTKKTIITSSLLENDDESRILKKVVEKNLVKPNKTILKLLTTLDNAHLKELNTALKWFEDTLVIVTPDAKPSALAHKIDIDNNFKSYANDLMKSFHIGVSNIHTQKKTLKAFFGEDDNNELNTLINKLDNSPQNMIAIGTKNGEEIVIIKEEKEYFVKKLQIEHVGKDDIKALFDLNEESDGTVRLLDFTPVFQDIANNERVYFIDEIERSIHPLLIKELIRKFSKDDNSNGQLIFTTHESNLLDQSIFREDEIWFAEKDKNGCTDLYSLSDYKDINTNDIQKGYLLGRYGSIPFLGNLKDLNWHDYNVKN
ncbi:MAG: ATP-binding protein [Campylobacterota bacterium]|nr:ATP-binding protein [Campylobacterota bacterium]